MITQVSGQLIRRGIFRNGEFSEACFREKLKCGAIQHVENGSFPTASRTSSMSQPLNFSYAQALESSYQARTQVRDLVLDDHNVYDVPVSAARVTSDLPSRLRLSRRAHDR